MKVGARTVTPAPYAETKATLSPEEWKVFDAFLRGHFHDEKARASQIIFEIRSEGHGLVTLTTTPRKDRR